MKFFFPDSHDLVNPAFDFETERKTFSGSRQQAYCYAHEVLSSPPYDGMLLSKAVIDPLDNTKSVRYNFTQVQRLKRLGAREFLRLDRPGVAKRIETMGDCGAFSYVNEPEPPFSIQDVITFYLDCQFDYGISPDHVILGFQDDQSKEPIPEEWKRRFQITLDRAEQFFISHRAQKLPFKAIGAAQGWSPKSYAEAVVKLESIGYDYIALGGMVPLKTHEILACLEEVAKIKKKINPLAPTGNSKVGKNQ